MKKSIPWLAAAAIIVIIFGTIYGAVQQAQRNDADMPQIQIAEDTAMMLNNNVSPQSVIVGRVDMAMSLAPFTIIFDKAGKTVGGSGYLDNQIPTAPFGVLKAADNKDFHRVTWQPQGNTRIAAVTVSARNYYVLSGRNMRQIEQNESQTMQIAAVGCLISLVILAAFYIAMQYRPQKNRKNL